MSRRSRRNTATSSWANSLRSNYARELEGRERDEEKRERLTGGLLNRVEKIHWYIKANSKLHNTIKFDQIHDSSKPKPVLRRGQPFHVALRFLDRDFDLKSDRIILNFKFGSRPTVTKGTMAVLMIAKDTFSRSTNDWDVKIDSTSKDKDLVLQVFIPASAPVGVWRLEVRSGLQDRSQGRVMDVYKEETDIFILFNPWCKDDLVYMKNDSKREEYVMNEKGKVYVGAYRTPRGRPWAFGQFDDVVLPVACYILEISKIAPSERGDPVQVVRKISAGVNDNDEDGILSGRWDGEYDDGVPPFKWTGSVRILETYIKNGFKPVKYGQCWVFSAITTTICRALGIPCRSVSNFVSAHDTDKSLTIDRFFTKSGDEIEGGPSGHVHDSIWNFHVWNDVWMARPDLPKDYGGWQAIDATPQEESNGVMQCGPASLEAIRRGDINLNYDCPFVFAEVNADVMHFREDEDSDWGFTRIKLNKYHVGKSVMTKKVGVEDDIGEEDRDDVVAEYKSTEGSVLERLAIKNAILKSVRAQRYYKVDEVDAGKEDVHFDLIELERISVGDSFQIKVVVRNDSDETRTVSAALTAKSIFYTGVPHQAIKKAGGTFTINSKSDRDVALTVSYEDYWKKLKEHCMIKMYVICSVEETGQTWTDEDDLQVEKPALLIKTPDKLLRGKETELVFIFTNPLNEELTKCTLNIDGSGLLRSRYIELPGHVEPKGEFKYHFKISPRIHGTRKLIVNFNSKELYDIIGSKTVNVLKI